MKINNIESSLKRFLKRKVKVTLGLVVAFMISGNLLAAGQEPDTKYDIEYIGKSNWAGNGYTGPIKETTNGINIKINGTDKSSDTTLAICFNGNKSYNVTGDINVVNTTVKEGIGNNDAIYAGGFHGGGTANITLGNKDSNIYLASIGNNDRTEYTGSGNGSSVLAAKGIFSKNVIQVTGKVVQLIGNIDLLFGEVTAILDSKDSFWYGSQTGFGTLNLTLSNGGQWIYNKSSTISNITLDDGIINLQDGEIKNIYETTMIKNVDENGNPVEYKLGDYRSDKAHKEVTINNLNGKGGIFKLDLDWTTNQGQNKATDKSDYIIINKVADDAKGNSLQMIDFNSNKANLFVMSEENKLYFAKVDDGGTSFTTIYGDKWTEVNSKNIFDYNYFVGSENNKQDWYIGLDEKGIGENGNFKMAKGAIYAAYALGTELDTLTKRAGEMRYVDGNQGMWVRYQNKQDDWHSIFKNEGQMVQIGYDRLVKGDTDKHYLGAAVDYADIDTSIKDIMGEGENERYSVSVYNTWLSGDGKYYDLVARVGRINNDYDTRDIFNDGICDVGSDYRQDFGSISGEYGINYDLGDGWYVKPQTQLQLTYIDGAEYVSDSGVRVEQKNMTSLIGRIGFNAGRTYEKVNYYLKADAMHEFAGDKEFTLTGADGSLTQKYEDEETWFTLGAGAEAAVTESTTLWCDMEHAFGSSVDSTWQVNVGFRYNF